MSEDIQEPAPAPAPDLPPQPVCGMASLSVSAAAEPVPSEEGWPVELDPLAITASSGLSGAQAAERMLRVWQGGEADETAGLWLVELPLGFGYAAVLRAADESEARALAADHIAANWSERPDPASLDLVRLETEGDTEVVWSSVGKDEA